MTFAVAAFAGPAMAEDRPMSEDERGGSDNGT